MTLSELLGDDPSQISDAERAVIEAASAMWMGDFGAIIRHHETSSQKQEPNNG
jgi:hypothetical protein